MAIVRYRSPDAPAFVVFEKARFRVEHGAFALRPAPLRRRVAAVLEDRRGWNLAAMKLVEEDRRLRACLEWLEAIPDRGDEVVVPDLVHEPALDVVADALIGDGEYERVECPSCEASYAPDEVSREAWTFEEDGVTVHGRRSTCPRGHTIHALIDLVDALDPEDPSS